MSSTSNYLPAEWDDNERMTAMFRNFTKNDKETARNSKMNFWKNALHKWTSSTGTLTFSIAVSFQKDYFNEVVPKYICTTSEPN